jgi:integrase
MRLDAKTVARIKLPDGKADAIFFDDDLTGFGLRLRLTGEVERKSWIAQYRRAGRTRRLKIGSIEKVTPDEARKAARKVLARVELGVDPAEQKATARAKAANTLRSVVDEYLDAKKSTVRASSFRVTELYLRNPRYFGPLHSLPITDVGLADVAARLKVIGRESGTVTASRARAALSAMYGWAMREGLCGLQPHNPVAITNAPKDSVPRERVLTDAELVAIWRACGDDDFGRIVRLLALTGCRRQEIGSLRWGEIDYEKGAIALPGERTKNGRAHVLPLPPIALDIIRGTLRRVGRDYLFGERAEKGFTIWAAKKAEFDARLGAEVGEWRIHDLRRSVATKMADIGVLPHVIEALLNHHSGHRAGVAGVYNRSPYEKDVRATLNIWADHLAEIVGRPRLRMAVKKSADAA